MSTVPAEIAGLGSTAMKLRVSPGFDPLKAQVGPEEYFVLSRIDGKQSIKEVLLQTGLPVDRGIAIVMKLRSIGALLLPGEAAAPVPASQPAKLRAPSGVTPVQPMTPPRGVMLPPRPMNVDVPTQRLPPNLKSVQLDAPTMRRPGASDAVPAPPKVADLPPPFDLSLPNPTGEEVSALSEVIDLDDTERRKILAMARLVELRDPHVLLGVPNTADTKGLKRAYFRLSKDVHPDRYYGKKLGSFAKRIPLVFEALARAYAKLTTPDKPKSGGHPTVSNAEQPQTPQEYAAELFERACALEINGEFLDAMKLFAAAVRIDGQLRYLRRATSCALQAGQPRSAVEYAKKAQSAAPTDASCARLLATAFRAAGQLGDAEEVLVMAMALRTENDQLASELRNDLAEVRKQLK